MAALALALATVPLAAASVSMLVFDEFLTVSPFADGTNWFVVEDARYRVKDTNLVVEVKRGFVTDLASIPRPFWSILPNWGKYGSPAIVHDFLYWEQRCTREQADRIFLLAMEDEGVNRFTRFVIHRAVSWGGKCAWKENRRLRDEGWERVMPHDQIPNKPTTTWNEWRKAIFDSGHRPPAEPGPPPEYCAQADAAWRAFEATH